MAGGERYQVVGGGRLGVIVLISVRLHVSI